MIELDYRENKLKDLFENKNIEFKLSNLDLADIQLKFNNDTVMYIERKTVSDLYSSINDGRYREQKARLLSNVNREQVMYVIEGSIYSKNSVIKKIVQGAITNMIFRDKLLVYRTHDIIDTFELILSLNGKIQNNYEWFTNNSNSNSSEVDYNHLIKSSKKENMTPKICAKVQLSQIPGVSHSMSDKIMENLNISCLSELVLKYASIEDLNERKLLLANMQISDKRKLGKVLSNRIYDYLFYNEN